MPENVSIRCEGNFIKVNWEWGCSDFISMKIFYKKKEIENGDGAEFTIGGVLYYPGKQNGNAEKRLTNESGLYTFTLLPVGQNGIPGENDHSHRHYVGRATKGRVAYCLSER